MIKQVFAPHLNANVKLGRKRPVALGPHLKADRYFKASLPAPPTSCDYTAKAAAALANIYDNDTLGDCVIAGGYHITGVATGNAGDLFQATSAQIIKDYSAIGGYVPGDPNTDNGCDEVTALNYWQAHGFADGTKILGWLAIDPSNLNEIMQAMYLFENLMFGVELPDAWISPFPSGSGFTWGAAGAPDPDNGHCVVGVGYNTNGVQIDTWGLIGTMTWAAVQQYCAQSAGGQLFVMITPDQLAAGQSKAPNGVAWTDLISDFDALGGNVPVPTPPAPTPPVPTPPTPVPPTPVPPSPTVVTLAQAEQWATVGLNALPRVITRQQASTAVISSLSKHWPKK
jgi:hypothetical protein